MTEAGAVTVRAARPGDAPTIAHLSRVLAEHVADPDPGGDTEEIAAARFGPGRWIEVIAAEHAGARF